MSAELIPTSVAGVPDDDDDVTRNNSTSSGSVGSSSGGGSSNGNGSRQVMRCCDFLKGVYLNGGCFMALYKKTIAMMYKHSFHNGLNFLLPLSFCTLHLFHSGETRN